MKTFCGYYDQGICQSCRLIETDYSDQLKAKEAKLTQALNIPLLPSVNSQTQGFRNKAKLTVTGSLDQPIIGLWGEDSLDLGREILNCPLHHPVINSILADLPDFIRATKLVPYQIKDKKGELKGVILYHSARSNETYLRFVLRSKESLDRIKKHLPLLQNKYPHLSCISANIQPVPHAILEGEEEIILSEKNYIEHELEGIKLKIGPKGFVQTNQTVAEKLYVAASSWMGELGIKRFAEVFSGQGAFSFFAARSVNEAIGFEIDSDAVKVANNTAMTLGLSHLKFISKDAAEIGTELKNFSPDLVLVNPPRRGLGLSLPLFKEGYPYLIYSSCSAETLIKDLKDLRDVYEIKRAQIFDMFPHTEHFETLVLLQRR